MDTQRTRSNEQRVLLAGFSAPNVNAIIEEGIDVQAVLLVKGKKENSINLGVETYDHFAAVRCEIDPPRTAKHLAEDTKEQLYNCAFDLFRRHYCRITSAHNISLRSWTHLENLFFIAARFFDDLITRKRITTVIFSNFPHEGSYIVFYHLAKMRGLNVLITSQTNFPEKMWIVRTIEDFGNFESVEGEGQTIETPSVPETPFYMKRPGRFRYAARTTARIASECLKLFGKAVTLKVFWDPQSANRNLSRLVHATQMLRTGFPSVKDHADVDFSKPYIYFPLHLQPEMTTNIWGFQFGDQLRAIEALSTAMPPGTVIYAKENPVQTSFMREESFFRRLRGIENVRYVSSEVSSFDLIRHSKCVATITGTAGWEAALMGKGMIHFGVTWYSGLPGVFKWEGPETLKKALEFKPDRRALEDGFEALSRKMYTGIVDPAYYAIMPEFDIDAEARKTAASIAMVLNSSPSDFRQRA